MSEREAYVEKVKAQIDQWNAEIAKFQAKAREATADAKIEYEEEIAGLKGRRDALLERLDELEKAGEGAWSDVRDATEKAFDGLKEAFAKARSRFSSGG